MLTKAAVGSIIVCLMSLRSDGHDAAGISSSMSAVAQRDRDWMGVANFDSGHWSASMLRRSSSYTKESNEHQREPDRSAASSLPKINIVQCAQHAYCYALRKGWSDARMDMPAEPSAVVMPPL
jgi:hypothetical protein